MKRAEDGVCVCLKRREERESLEHSAVARAVQPAVRESLREPGAFPCAVMQRLRAERRGASVLSRQGIIPQQHSMCLGDAGGRARGLPRERKVTKAVRSKKRAHCRVKELGHVTVKDPKKRVKKKGKSSRRPPSPPPSRRLTLDLNVSARLRGGRRSLYWRYRRWYR